jgi:DNA-directed RNA polymerase subunit RPC12/RpoP
VPGTNAGTGQPLTLRCSKCRRNFFEMQRRSSCGTNLVRTGVTKPLAKSQRGNGGRRVLQERVQYRCLDCGHVGLTRVKDVLNKPFEEDEGDDNG